jgi:hypothetical protein
MDNSYQKQAEPSSYKKRSYNWKTAIGLQQVDGLTPTDYLVDLANYNNLRQNVAATTKPLTKFFGNLLLGEHNDLKNRELQTNWRNK